ncbi:MAG: acyloxyacyl hydrolase [Flavobacteriaceae bacterium]
MFQNSLRKYILISIFCTSFFTAIGQEKEENSRKLKKIGFLFNSAKQNNLLFSDRDYDYKTTILKGQLFYHLSSYKSWEFNLIVQPQFQISKHQLLNKFFIPTNSSPDFEELREKFLPKKTISIYALELGLQFKRKLSELFYAEFTLGLGAGYIDIETERMAQGFTFIENISLGLSYRLKESEIYIGSNVGHVSNLDFQQPNHGYNIFGFEIGYRIYIK